MSGSLLTGSPPLLCMETSQLICMVTSQGKVRGTVWLGPHFLTSVYDANGGFKLDPCRLS